MAKREHRRIREPYATGPRLRCEGAVAGLRLAEKKRRSPVTTPMKMVFERAVQEQDALAAKFDRIAVLR